MTAVYKSLLRVSIISLIISTVFIRTAMAQQSSGYPKMVGYFSTVLPVASLANGKITSNYTGVYTQNFPFGFNLFKSDKFGVSFEIAPTMRVENHIAKISTISFNPGAVFRLKHDFAIIQRVAFETSGRFGVTTIFNKIVIKGKDASLFLAVPFATRTGNNLPTSLTTGLQVGVFF
ncbi:hypothetical protein [Mucilaginibacter sp. UYCu711]|uniref:hypothetical protein n=1 Tax=Mucilaginibacter sp. UYCu711 TaxID=3156339 RepID=UPI003D19810F